MAVWSLRVGYSKLTGAIAGLIAMALGSTPWVLARRSDHLARRRCRRRDVVGVLLVPARASRATAWVLVHAVHAHP